MIFRDTIFRVHCRIKEYEECLKEACMIYASRSYNITIDTMEVQGERKDEDRGPSYEGGYLYSDICRTWDRTGHIAAFHVFT